MQFLIVHRAILPMPKAFLCWNSFLLLLLLSLLILKVVTLKRDKSLFFIAKRCMIFHDFKRAFYEVSGLIQCLSVSHFSVVLLIVSQVLYLVGIIQLTYARTA